MVKSAEASNVRTGCLWLLFLLILSSVPIAMIVEGIEYHGRCPAEIWIPRYMIVMGVTQIITIWLKIMHVMCLHACDMKDNLCTFSVAILTGLWNFGWLIAGSVWIFSLHNMMSTNPSSPFFCDPTIVMFGLYVTSITWVLLGIAGIYFAVRFFC